MNDHDLKGTSKIAYIPYQAKGDDDGSIVKSDSESSSYSSSDDEEDQKQPEESSPGGSGIGKRSKRLGPKALKAIEGVSLAIAITVVLSLFSLPIYFYKTDSAKNQNSTNSSSLSSTVGSTPGNSSDACSSLSWGVASSLQCSGTPYMEGGVCTNSLLTWQKCGIAVGSDGPLMVAVSASEQNTLEEVAQTFFDALDEYGQLTSADCNSVAVPFVCLYFFPLCDGGGQELLPSKELCLLISTDVCRQQWSLALSFDQGDLLPVCADLPVADSTQNITAIPAVPANISCSFGFTVDNGVCIPDCYTFLSGPRKREEWNRIIIGVSAGFGLLMSLVLFISSFVRRKIMWKFPYVFLIYVTMDYTIMGFFILLSLGDRGLYCNSNNAVDAISNPTIFCTVTAGYTHILSTFMPAFLQRVVIHYFVVNMTYFWFFHVCSTFYKVVFPHMARRTESKQGFIHAGLVFLAIILPLPPVVIVLTNEDYQYTIPSFPVYFCLSRSTNQIVFYSIILVLNLLLAVGVCLFIPMCYIIHKHRHAISTKKRRKWRISSIERKLLITLCYFVAFGVVSLVYLAVELAEQNKITDIQKSYYVCEAPGIPPANSSLDCDHYLEELNDYNTLRTAAYTLLGLLPLMIFIFVVDWKRLIKKLKTRLGRYCFPRVHHEEQVLAFSTYSPASVTSIN